MSDLHGWTIIGLRASDQQAPLRRAALACGATFLSLPGLRLLPMVDAEAARLALHRALACPLCVFTSPAAVRFAQRLVTLREHLTQAVAIGSGTASALRRASIRDVVAPVAAMHSEGVLALPALSPPLSAVGLVTAPGGRGVLLRVLQERGAQVAVAEVYRRQAAVISAQARQRLATLTGPTALLISSAEALQTVHAQLDAAERAALRRAVAVCASPRLRDVAESLGFTEFVDCGATRPRLQLRALSAHAKARAFR